MKRRGFLGLLGLGVVAPVLSKVTVTEEPSVTTKKISKTSKIYEWEWVSEPGISLATRAEAEAGTINGVYMTPEKVRRLSEQLGEFYSLPHPIRNLPS